MNGYELRTEKKKDRIRYSALELFSLHGVNNTSIAKVAEKAGVAPATVYNYFGTKDQLVKNTVIYFIEKKWDSLKRILDSDMPFPELLEHIVFTREELTDKISLDFINELINVNPDDEMKKYIDEFYHNRFPGAIHQFIDKGRTEGFIHKELSNDAVMLYLEMYRDAAHRPNLLSNKNKNLLKELYSMMLYGLAGQPEFT
jgi:AcrR family transcriptional regulator